MTLCEDFKAEFSKRKVLFKDCKASNMYTSKFQDCVLLILLYRAAALVFAFGILISLLSRSDDPGRSYTFFTIWSYNVLILYFLSATITSVVHIIKNRKQSSSKVEDVNSNVEKKETTKENDEEQGEKMEGSIPEEQQLLWYMKIQWILYNIALPASFIVTLIYWAVLFPMGDGQTDIIDISIHALNMIFMVTEQYIAAIPTRILHAYHPISYGLSYMIFSLILWSTNGEALYPFVIDWNSPGVTIGAICGIVLFITVAQVVLFFIYRALMQCAAKRKDGTRQPCCC